MHIKKQTFVVLAAILFTGCGAMVPVVKMENIPPEQRRVHGNKAKSSHYVSIIGEHERFAS